MGNYVSDKKNARFFGLKLFWNRDAELIERLESTSNVQNYLKDLIRADIARNPAPPPAPQEGGPQ